MSASKQTCFVSRKIEGAIFSHGIKGISFGMSSFEGRFCDAQTQVCLYICWGRQKRLWYEWRQGMSAGSIVWGLECGVCQTLSLYMIWNSWHGAEIGKSVKKWEVSLAAFMGVLKIKLRCFEIMSNSILLAWPGLWN